MFSNSREARVPRDCLRIVTHPSVGGGTAGRVRGTGGPCWRGWMAGGGPVTGCLAARAAATTGLLAGHLVDVAAAEGGGGGEGGDC